MGKLVWSIFKHILLITFKEKIYIGDPWNIYLTSKLLYENLDGVSSKKCMLVPQVFSSAVWDMTVLVNAEIGRHHGNDFWRTLCYSVDGTVLNLYGVNIQWIFLSAIWIIQPICIFVPWSVLQVSLTLVS